MDVMNISQSVDVPDVSATVHNPGNERLKARVWLLCLLCVFCALLLCCCAAVICPF